MSEAIVEPVAEPVAEPTPATPAAEPVVEPPSWRESLSPDNKSHPALADFKDVDGLAKSYIHQGQLIGVDKFALPKDDWTPEQFDEHYTKLGRPESADGYELGDLEVPEGLPWDDEFQGAMVEKMHGLGLNTNQVKGVLGAYIESIGGQYETATGDANRATEAGIEALRKEWGTSYPAQVDVANRAFLSFAGDRSEEVRQMLMADGTQLGDNPAFIRVFAAAGSMMSEHGLVGGGPAARETLAPAEAEAKINELMADEDFRKQYYDKNNPAHEAANKRMAGLYGMQYPEPQ